MPETPLVLTFHDERCRDVDLAGGKGASLASMTQTGSPSRQASSSPRKRSSTPSTARPCCATSTQRTSTQPGRWSQPTPPPRGPHQGAYDALNARSVAVRSSACAEDGNDASYAGQQETYLFVESFEEVMEKVVECWLSFFSDRALFYRVHKGSSTTSTWRSWSS